MRTSNTIIGPGTTADIHLCSSFETVDLHNPQLVPCKIDKNKSVAKHEHSY